MRVKWNLKHVEISNGLRRTFEERIDKFGRRLQGWSDDALSLVVAMEKIGSKEQFKCTLNLHLPQKTLHAAETREEKKTAFNAAFDDLVRQEKRMMARFRRQDRYEDVAEAKRSIAATGQGEEGEETEEF